MRTLFDRAQSRGESTLEFFGTNITLPPEARFASVESVRRYVDDVLGHPAVAQRWPDAEPLAVRSRRGCTAAHYERGAGGGTIAVPDRTTTWALRELVVSFGHFTAVYAQTRRYTLDLSVERDSLDSYL